MASDASSAATRPEWLDHELARADVAAARGQLEQGSQPHATAARYDARHGLVVVELGNGAQFAFPPQLGQGLTEAKPAELAEIEISPAGTALYWPRLDVDLSVAGLLAGLFGSRWWMRELGRKAGIVRSAAKAQASRINGAKGGRPRKSSQPV